MDVNWQPPSEWEKAGIRISNVSGLKTRAWALILSAKETRAGDAIARDVIIKAFKVPLDIVQDAQRIAKEGNNFLAAARLQRKLVDGGARGWVKIRAISEDPANPAFIMDKCGPSLQDFIDNRARLSANDFYVLTLAVIDALNELFQREKRSHGKLKASDVLAAGPTGSAAYQLADPSPSGDTHSANDLYCLGQILFKLIEHKDYDPLVPLASTKEWDRFGARRDRWVQFCTMLLSPNGWHEPLPQVAKEAMRLKPVSRLRGVAVAATAIVLIAGATVAVDRYVARSRGQLPAATTNVAIASSIDPQVKSDFEAARQTYIDAREKWIALNNTSHYSHTKAQTLARTIRNLLPDQTKPLTDDDSCRAAADGYRKATQILQQALTIAISEDQAGRDLEKQDESSHTAFQDAHTHYQQINEKWNAALHGIADGDTRADIAAAKALAEEAHNQLPDQFVLTDAASYQAGTANYQTAADKLDKALSMLQNAPPPETRPAVDVSAAIAKGNQALEAQNYPEAMHWYQTAANCGNAPAMCNVGLLYETGKAGPKDMAQATTWYTKAADANYVPALLDLASLYEKDQNYGKAFACYKKAAELNDPRAMVGVGNCYENALGTDEDAGAAFHWYQRAAALNNSAAMTNLGVLYEKGRGVPLDYAQAMAWYQKAVALNNPAAMNAIGAMYDNGRGVKNDPIQAMTFYKQAAALNFAPAMTNIGTLYDSGQGVPRDAETAMTWFRKAADLGDGMAMYNVGVLYENGRGVDQNVAEALTWYRRAEKAGDSNARQVALDRIGRLGFPP